MTDSVVDNRKQRITVSILRSSVWMSLMTLVIVACLEVFMLIFTVMYPQGYGEYLWRYRTFYIALLCVAVICILLIRYAKRDMDGRYRILEITHPICAFLLMVWSLGITYSDAEITGVVNPAVFMTFSLLMPLSYFMMPWIFAILVAVADIIMLVIVDVYAGIDMTSINLIVFFIFQFVLGISFLRIRIMLAERIVDEQDRANIDVLTGCMNRSVYVRDTVAFDNDSAWDRLVFVVVDVNGLKIVNDRCGHDEGDKLIVETANGLKSVFGSDGRVYRVGGDEFVVLAGISDSEVEDRLAKLDDILKKKSANRGFEMSVSHGYSSRSYANERRIKEMAKIADDIMYLSKDKYYRDSGLDRRKR